jgi:hypothetical protein
VGGPSRAGTIATCEQPAFAFFYTGAQTGMALQIMAGSGVFPCVLPFPGCPLLLDQTLTLNDVHTTFALNATTAANFAEIASVITGNAGGAFYPTPVPGITFPISFTSFSFLSGAGPDYARPDQQSRWNPHARRRT